jgi:hypothetical protein
VVPARRDGLILGTFPWLFPQHGPPSFPTVTMAPIGAYAALTAVATGARPFSVEART